MRMLFCRRSNLQVGVWALLAGTVLYSIVANVSSINNALDQMIQIKTERSSSSSKYIPASSEQYVRDHARQLGYDNATYPVPTCSLWTRTQTTESSGDSTTASTVHNHIPPATQDDLKAFHLELKRYNRLVQGFQPIPDLRSQLALDESNLDQVCRQVELEVSTGSGTESSLQALFPSRQLSLGSSGYMEPLLPPLRHADFCVQPEPARYNFLMDLTFLVHDFGAMCRKLKRTSRTVLVDMGASLDFHEQVQGSSMPAVYLTDLYHKFGFKFDHIYAYEVTPKDPKLVWFEQVPDRLMASYHWINTGVTADRNSSLNPLHMILDHFNEDDFIVVKLDIDTPGIEVPLAQQLLHDTALHGLVDQFYFEHHVMLADLAPWWGNTMRGSVRDSLELFASLREVGVAAHSWV
jgi:hypothetical protein